MRKSQTGSTITNDPSPPYRGGVPNEFLDLLIAPLGLSDAELDDLLEFLLSLTGSNVDALVSDAHAAPIGGG